MNGLLQDVRYALRQLRKNPGFTAVAAITLALGIGANTAMFSVVQHVLLAPLAFPQPERLYAISESTPGQASAKMAVSGPDFVDYHEQSQSFSHTAALVPMFTMTWTGDGDPKIVSCTGATEDLFPMLGIRPFLGRLYTPREYTYLENDTIVISYRFWKNQLSGDPHVIGRVLHFEDSSETVIGVLPPIPDLFPDTDVWPKLTIRPSWDFMKWRSNKFLTVIGRLTRDANPAAAREGLTAILRRGPGRAQDARVELTTLKETQVGSVRTQLRIVMAAVATVLLIACVNVAALLLTRAAKRAPEMAVRLGVGATPLKIARQFFTENLILVASGSAPGLLLAWFGLRFVRVISPYYLPRSQEIHLSISVLSIATGVVLVTTMLFTAVPFLVLSKLNLASSIRSGRSETAQMQRRPLSLLVATEIGFAVVLAVSAALLLRSFWKVQRVPLGFVPDHVLTTYLRTNFYGPEGRAFWQDVLTGVSSLPGLRSAAVSSCAPAKDAPVATLVFDDRPTDPNHMPAVQGCWSSADFFKTVGSRLLQGRWFAASDNADAPPVAIINQEAARRFWPGQNPIGKSIIVSYTGPGRRDIASPRMREVVGIVEDIKQGAPERQMLPAVYMPYLQDETYHVFAGMRLFIRGGGSPLTLANSIRAKIWSIRADQPVDSIRTMNDILDQSLAFRRYSLILLEAFAFLALLLCALGIYGVVSYVALQRTREFGVRVALGATRANVLGTLLRQSLTLTAMGISLGVAFALASTRLLRQVLFEVSPMDAASFATVVTLLAIVSLCACLIPACRAAKVDPMVALRYE